MTAIDPVALGDKHVTLNPAVINDLREAVRGEVLLPVNPGYDAAREVWNAMIDRRPALIVRCAGTADVIRAVDLAREHGLLLSVCGGGHNVAGAAVCDGGLMIDLSRMRSVYVDPTTRRARVQGGATWGDVDHETQVFGLAVPGGVVSTTGVGGLTLGGGIGWLSRKHGLTVDNLRSVHLVTAAGEALTASEDDHPDLFWAVRGGGGNFGVVTWFEFELQEVGPEVLFGPTVYRYGDAPDVLRHYREFARQTPRECCIWVDSLIAPPLPFLPEEAHGTRVLSVVSFYAGNVAEGEEVLRPLREYGDPIADAVSSIPHKVAQTIFDALYAKGARNYWKSHNLVELSDGAIDTLVEYAERLPTPQSDILIHQVGGAVNDVSPDATAYPHREAEFVITPGARWVDPARDDECIAWVRDWHDAMAPHATGGSYVNMIGDREGGERSAYGTNYERLVGVKRRYDPANLFRMNQNIRP